MTDEVERRSGMEAVRVLLADIVNSNRLLLSEVKEARTKLDDIVEQGIIVKDRLDRVGGLRAEIDRLTVAVQMTSTKTAALLDIVTSRTKASREKGATGYIPVKLKKMVEVYDSLHGVVKVILWLAPLAGAGTAFVQFWRAMNGEQ
jgi:hypothetical protein